MSPVLLDICNITKTYAAKPKPIEALKAISLQLYQGEILGLLGVNGAGKTTLSSLITTLHPPTSGDIMWRGNSIYRQLLEYRRHIGFCPQKQNFDPLLTVEQNLLFAGRYFLMSDTDSKNRIKELMDRFDLQKYAHMNIEVLSGGYRQRLLIARALLPRPSLVVLDEPTIALDPHIRRQLWDLIFELKEQGITILFTTHYIDEAEVLSDRVCILDNGSIRLIDNPKNLLSAYNKTRLEDVFLQLTRENDQESKGDR